MNKKPRMKNLAVLSAADSTAVFGLTVADH